MSNNFQLLQSMMQQRHKSPNSLMDFAPFGYMWMNVNSKKLIASHTIYDMLEIEPFSEFLTLQKWRKYIHPTDLYKLLQGEEQLLHSGNPVLIEYRLITKTGRHLYVTHQMILSVFPHGETKIMSIICDVTKQKSGEIILEAMNECFFELDERLRLRRVNEKARMFWNLAHTNFGDRNLVDIFPEIEGTDFHALLSRAQSEKISLVQETMDPVTTHWIHLSVSPYADGIIVIFFDLQNEKEAEWRLQESRNLYSSLAENTPDVITRWGKDLKLIYANPAFAKKTGISIENLYGKTSLEMGQPGEIAIPYMNSLRKAFETGQQVEHFNSFPTPAGELYFFSRIIPEKNKKDNVETVLAIARDITEIKRAELELKEKENRVAELNKSLVSMNKELISANSELKAFTGIAATNYSETLRHLYINLELIVTNDARNLSNSGRANLRRAQGAIQKMKLLTDDLVSFSRLHDIGSKEEHVDLNKILHATVNDFTSKITHPLVEINCDQLPIISGYPLLLPLLFTHLIDNAIKFRRQDKGHVIHVSCREAVNGNEINIEGAEKTASYHIITISDNGIGFPQAESEKIFEMFYRLHEQGKFKGSGIGLAVCKKVMEMHDGFITAEGIPDQGAIFHCYFPA